LIDIVFLKATGNHSGDESWATLLYWLMKFLPSLCYSYFVIQRFGAAAVSQANSTITDGIKGLPTFDTRLIVTV
jgi:hypothetical protein